MAEWICNLCKTEIEEVDDIFLKFNDLELPPALGFRCPSCKTEYLSSEYTTGELNSAEIMLQGK